jgi:hypothetical protein
MLLPDAQWPCCIRRERGLHESSPKRRTVIRRLVFSLLDIPMLRFCMVIATPDIPRPLVAVAPKSLLGSLLFKDSRGFRPSSIDYYRKAMGNMVPISTCAGKG